MLTDDELARLEPPKPERFCVPLPGTGLLTRDIDAARYRQERLREFYEDREADELDEYRGA